MFKKYAKIIPVILFGLLVALPASALTILPDCKANPNDPLCCAVGTATPSLQCFLLLLGQIAKWIIGISGGLALLFFIYGGFMLLISRGNEQQITKGKDILSKAIIGVIIIFGAYFAVDFLSRTVLQATVPKTPEGALIEKMDVKGLEQAAPTTPTTQLVNCTCSPCTDGFVPKIGAGSVALCTSICSSACTMHLKTPTPPSCNCVCSNNITGIVKDLSATPDKKNLTANCVTFCSLRKSTMKSCN
ncbi:pilin [Patescibacteria group bacterium]|nr:pilin [Patescibacteria group bacterium]